MYEMILDNDDFLRYQLFFASKSPTIKKRRMLSRLIMVITFLVLAYAFYQDKNMTLTYYFLAFAFISILLFPRVTKWRYEKMFRKHIEDNYKNKVGISVQVGFEKGHVLSKDSRAESKIKLSELEVINEIRENIFIKIKTGDTFVIPKNMERLEEFKADLTKVAEKYNLKWHTENFWRWK